MLVGGDWLPFLAFSHDYWVAVIIPIDFHIFQRGGPTTNQYGFDVHDNFMGLELENSWEIKWEE